MSAKVTYSSPYLEAAFRFLSSISLGSEGDKDVVAKERKTPSPRKTSIPPLRILTVAQWKPTLQEPIIFCAGPVQWNESTNLSLQNNFPFVRLSYIAAIHGKTASTSMHEDIPFMYHVMRNILAIVC